MHRRLSVHGRTHGERAAPSRSRANGVHAAAQLLLHCLHRVWLLCEECDGVARGAGGRASEGVPDQ